MEGGISEEGEFGTQTSGKQFEIGEIKSWERRAGPPAGKFQMAVRKDSVRRRWPEAWAEALRSDQQRTLRKEQMHPQQWNVLSSMLSTCCHRLCRWGGIPGEAPGWARSHQQS